MCIKDGEWKPYRGKEIGIWPDPKYGDIATVANIHEELGFVFYSLAEFHPSNYYECSLFITLSSIDEIELVNQREKTEPCISTP